MGLLARWLSVPLLGPLVLRPGRDPGASRGREKTSPERSRFDEIGGDGVTIRERRTATMELSDFAIGETFWTHVGASAAPTSALASWWLSSSDRARLGGLRR